MKNILKGFSKFEKIWVTLFTFLIMATTIYFSATMTDYTSFSNILLNWIISPLSAITGVFCVVLCAKGKISTFAWGLVNCITYGYVAYKGGVYGDMIINLLYFLPLQFVGYFVWKNKMSHRTETVRSELLKHPVRLTLIALVSWVAFSELLISVDHWFTAAMQKSSAFYNYMPKGWGAFLDASTEVGQFFGQILLTFAKVEQWFFWIAINVVSIYMWACIIMADKTSLPWALPTLIMWIAYLGNSFYGLIMWKKDVKEQEKQIA